MALTSPAAPTPSTIAFVLAGGRGTRMHQLTDTRAKPAVPFAGSLRLIDFALGNCINSGLGRIGVLTQYHAAGLAAHVRRTCAAPEALRGARVDLLPPRDGGPGYRGTADAVWQNIAQVQASGAAHVLVLAGDHVCKIDFARLVADHIAHAADVTVACVDVARQAASEFGVVCTDAGGRITDFVEKPEHPECRAGQPGVARASMGIYVFDAAFLRRALARDADDPHSSHDFGRDLIPHAIGRARAFAHDFALSCAGPAGAPPYWRDVGTLDAYWQAHMDLTVPGAAPDPFDAAWPIRGEPQCWPPARFETGAAQQPGVATDSLVCGGCAVRGATVRRSVLCAQVQVGEGSVVDDCVLLPGVEVGRGVVLRRAIVDEGCVLPDGLRIGVEAEGDRARYTVSGGGVALVVPAMLRGRLAAST